MNKDHQGEQRWQGEWMKGRYTKIKKIDQKSKIIYIFRIN